MSHILKLSNFNNLRNESVLASSLSDQKQLIIISYLGIQNTLVSTFAVKKNDVIIFSSIYLDMAIDYYNNI
jgi:hypothetical protein